MRCFLILGLSITCLSYGMNNESTVCGSVIVGKCLGFLTGQDPAQEALLGRNNIQEASATESLTCRQCFDRHWGKACGCCCVLCTVGVGIGVSYLPSCDEAESGQRVVREVVRTILEMR